MDLFDDHSPIPLRIASPEDAPSIEFVLHAAFSEFDALYTPEAFAATTPSAEELEKRWHEGPVWVALREGQLVGTVGVVPRGKELYIRSMAVLPAARGMKIGDLLLDQVERYARTGDFGRMYLSTTPFLLAAIRLYEHYGFRRATEGPHELLGTPLFTMERMIKS